MTCVLTHDKRTGALKLEEASGAPAEPQPQAETQEDKPQQLPKHTGGEIKPQHTNTVICFFNSNEMTDIQSTFLFMFLDFCSSCLLCLSCTKHQIVNKCDPEQTSTKMLQCRNHESNCVNTTASKQDTSLDRLVHECNKYCELAFIRNETLEQWRTNCCKTNTITTILLILFVFFL